MLIPTCIPPPGKGIPSPSTDAGGGAQEAGRGRAEAARRGRAEAAAGGGGGEDEGEAVLSGGTQPPFPLCPGRAHPNGPASLTCLHLGEKLSVKVC